MQFATLHILTVGKHKYMKDVKTNLTELNLPWERGEINNLIKMRLFYFIILTTFLTSCYSTNEAKQDNQIWSDFVSKIEDRDTAYLIQNSLDSITCYNCTENDRGQLHSSELIFNKYLGVKEHRRVGVVLRGHAQGRVALATILLKNTKRM